VPEVRILKLKASELSDPPKPESAAINEVVPFGANRVTTPSSWAVPLRVGSPSMLTKRLFPAVRTTE
jgi:hypothetical protein